MTKGQKDTLYQINNVDEDFVFSEHVVEVFDDMLDRSVPFYQEVISASATLLNSLLKKDDIIVDLGCATGTTLLEFSRVIVEESIHYVGIDNCAAMLEKARMKARNYLKDGKISFVRGDITTIGMQNIGAFILNYTLQFIRPVLREEFLYTIYRNLRPGGLLLLSEKTISHDSLLNRIFIECYHNYKKDKGYSELEIAKKREALENVLIPFSIKENTALLEKIGFQPVETYFQWINFISIIAIKPQTAT